MIDFEFEFQYAEEKQTALQKIGGSIPAGRCVVLYAIAAKAMANQMVTDGRQDTILAASEMLQSWVSVALVAGVIVAAFIGAAIGKRTVKKHLAA